MSEAYQMPKPKVGDIVLFTYSKNDHPSPAFVMKVNYRTIDVFVFRFSSPPLALDGVRAWNDPELTFNEHLAKRGFWMQRD